MTDKLFSIDVSDRIGSVSAIWAGAEDPDCVAVLSHGAGAGMSHNFMSAVAERLARNKIASLRFNFPYIESGRRSPNAPPVLLQTVGRAVEEARDTFPDARLIAGGKSMGGRMVSIAASKGMIDDVSGLFFLGFPLHAPGRPSDKRAAHLKTIVQPMLFLQGTRDRLANLDFLEPVCQALSGTATLHVVQDADHSFKMPKRSGRSQSDVLDELIEMLSDWLQTAIPA